MMSQWIKLQSLINRRSLPVKYLRVSKLTLICLTFIDPINQLQFIFYPRSPHHESFRIKVFHFYAFFGADVMSMLLLSS